MSRHSWLRFLPLLLWSCLAVLLLRLALPWAPAAPLAAQAPQPQALHLLSEPSSSEQAEAEQEPPSVREQVRELLDAPAGQCQYEYPGLADLHFNNIHWQRMTSQWANGSTSASFYLYNAYYDDRWRGGQASVRVLAMIDRIQPPPTSCLLWSKWLRPQRPRQRAQALLVPARFVYAWYPKWGNYRDGRLQPWIITCPLPGSHARLVPDSVSLVPAASSQQQRRRRQAAPASASPALPASFSSAAQPVSSTGPQQPAPARGCAEQPAPLPAPTNNLPVFNRRPQVRAKFAVCVKGLDFPHQDVSVRLVEWIELLHLLGAQRIFFYLLDIHPNMSKVLHYYQQRGLVELTELTLPGDQPNLPRVQHEYLKSELTAKRQNELIPYNDCLYRNLNSYQYLALLDIDEIIMPLQHQNWFDLMREVERDSLAERNYSRASYNLRNVYFFDDLTGPLGTTSASSGVSSTSGLALAQASEQQQQQQQEEVLGERGIPHYLHMMQHVYRSKNYTKPGQYVKCFHNTDRVVSLHNHFPMNCFGQCTTYSVPVQLAHLQHYRKDCVGPLKQSCKNDFRLFTTRDTTIWKYKQQMIRRTTRVLHQLHLLSSAKPSALS